MKSSMYFVSLSLTSAGNCQTPAPDGNALSAKNRRDLLFSETEFDRNTVPDNHFQQQRLKVFTLEISCFGIRLPNGRLSRPTSNQSPSIGFLKKTRDVAITPHLFFCEKDALLTASVLTRYGFQNLRPRNMGFFFLFTPAY